VIGPTTCVYPFTRIDDAIARANELPLAFQSSIFTEDSENRLPRGRTGLAASAVIVNDHTAFRTDWIPFTGHRQSGDGIGGIPRTKWIKMSQEKMIVFPM
jgi:acyl-CoA reductase-like NAD-dependent aldehyde dehydrogenase